MTENDIAAASASMLGVKVVPLRWITTCDALESLISDSAGAADLLKAESVIDAVKAKALKALALVRKGTEWEEYPLPTAYWETAAGSDAIWTGEVVAMSLPAQSKWLDSKPLCFLRAEWEAWLAGHPPAPTPKENGQQRAPKPTAERMGSWYRQRVADHDPSQPPPTRREDEKAAKADFECGGLKDLVREARNKYAPAQWKESGPKGRKVKAHAARAIAIQPGPK
jgi:hypothetical protein